MTRLRTECVQHKLSFPKVAMFFLRSLLLLFYFFVVFSVPFLGSHGKVDYLSIDVIN